MFIKITIHWNKGIILIEMALRAQYIVTQCAPNLKRPRPSSDGASESQWRKDFNTHVRLVHQSFSQLQKRYAKIKERCARNSPYRVMHTRTDEMDEFIADFNTPAHLSGLTRFRNTYTNERVFDKLREWTVRVNSHYEECVVRLHAFQRLLDPSVEDGRRGDIQTIKMCMASFEAALANLVNCSASTSGTKHLII